MTTNTYAYATDDRGRTHLFEPGGDGRNYTFCVRIDPWWALDPQPAYDVMPSCNACHRESLRREAIKEWHKIGEPHAKHEGCDGQERDRHAACNDCGKVVYLQRSQETHRRNEWVIGRHVNPWDRLCAGSGSWRS